MADLMAFEEEELKVEVLGVEEKANLLQISDVDSYKLASEMVKNIKSVSKKVKDYWEPLRKSTYDAYNTVNKKKKQMLDPLEKAEKLIKGKISDYTIEQEKKREEEQKAQLEEAEQYKAEMLRVAKIAESEGREEEAEFARIEAEMALDAVSVGTSEVKVDGISKVKDFKIKSIDADKVPISYGGVVIRPVDESAILKLIKETKGRVEIPGVEFEETYNIRVKA